MFHIVKVLYSHFDQTFQRMSLFHWDFFNRHLFLHLCKMTSTSVNLILSILCYPTSHIYIVVVISWKYILGIPSVSLALFKWINNQFSYITWLVNSCSLCSSAAQRAHCLSRACFNHQESILKSHFYYLYKSQKRWVRLRSRILASYREWGKCSGKKLCHITWRHHLLFMIRR